MSAGATVVASDLGAFRRVLDEGDAGVLFKNGDSADLAATLVRVLGDPELRRSTSARASAVVRRYDWSTVTHQVLTVYEMVLAGSPDVRVAEDPSSVRGSGARDGVGR
jgi:phosphatidylinositol alpha-mannosyltransferase